MNWFFAVPLAIATEAPAGPAGTPGISKECQDLSVNIPKKIEEFRSKLEETKTKFSPGFFLSAIELAKKVGEFTTFESQMNSLALTAQSSKSLLQQWARFDCGKQDFQNKKASWLQVASDYNNYIGALLDNATKIRAVLDTLKYLGSPIVLLLNFFSKDPSDIRILMEDLNYDELVGKSQADINQTQTAPDLFGGTTGGTQINPCGKSDILSTISDTLGGKQIPKMICGLIYEFMQGANAFLQWVYDSLFKDMKL